MKYIKYTIILLILTCQFSGSFGQKITGQKTGKYLQEVKNDILLPGEEIPNITQLLKNDDQIIALSPGKIFYFKNEKWSTKTINNEWHTTVLDPVGKLWLGNPNKIVNIETNQKIDFQKINAKDTVFCMFWESERILHLGTSQGFWTWNGSWKQLPGTEGIGVKQIAKGINNDIWLACSNGIFRRRDNEWINLDDFVMAPGLKRGYVSIAKGASPGDVIFGNAISVAQISEEGNHWTYTKEDGLPYGPATTICYSNNELWLGTPKGAIKKDKRWHYYHGKRWLPDNKINDILRIDPYTVWIATPKGISEIKNVEMTLTQKSKRFNQRLNDRHIHHGFVADCRFDSPGDTTTAKCYTSDNDGLWTSIYLASESFRYAVTGAQDAYDNAVRTFKAMERLETINPIPGFVARSYVKIDETTGRGGEWHVSQDGKWKWKADTSSDEIVGHMFAYPIFYELVAKGEIKERCRNLVHRLMTHIVDNNYNLIDLDGKPTRWGVW
ncbi:MAG: hypothetical protein R3182_02050, partial [Draconibacterium sp.]|nr:hypothetical protein [Draconibacterium sp.]